MKKTLHLLFFLLLTISSFSQENFNLDFEKITKGTPSGWTSFGNSNVGSSNYSIAIDTVNFQQGSKSVSISFDKGTAGFKAWSYTIPAKYQGSKIKLSGYLKTESVTGGHAGLWLRIDPEQGFDNMANRKITGTTDWKYYEIEMDLHSAEAKNIVFGGLLVGEGKIWLDNLSLTIDGVPIKDALRKALLPAEKDEEFNKGSTINFPKLTEKNINDLTVLGKVWGFLKYHHPAIGKGNYNWDYELFRILPTYLQNKNTIERDEVLLNWIAGLGEIPLCETCKGHKADAFAKADHSWMDDSDLSEQLKKKLNYILKNRHQGLHFYIGISSYIRNPVFQHEEAYTGMPYPDEGFRLLAVYRYWNMIHYFFPYKHLMDKDWNVVLKEYIPTFINAKDELAYEFAAVQLIGDIQDTHANIWRGNDAMRKWKGKYYPPIHVRFVEEELVITDFYNPEMKEEVGLKIGDVITKINGVSVDEIVNKIKPYYPASNEAARHRDVSADLLRSNDKEIQLNYIRNKKEKAIKLSLYERDSLDIYRWYRPSDEKCYKLLENNIGYVTLANINFEDTEKIKEAFKDTKGIIIDIRNYPSTFVPFSLGGYFVSDTTAFVKFTAGSVDAPGEFTFTDPIRIPNSVEHYSGKLIVIVNELSQSQAEYTAMAFRAGDNTTIIGSTTAGADGNVSALYLPGGLRTMISGLGVFYPDGTETQRIGIIPDIEIKPTIKGVRKGRDEVLEKAIELILK